MKRKFNNGDKVKVVKGKNKGEVGKVFFSRGVYFDPSHRYYGIEFFKKDRDNRSRGNLIRSDYLVGQNEQP